MIIELINTGTELLLGRTLNTHQQWLGRRLADLGYPVSRQVALPDTGPEIQQAVHEALQRADLIIATGGLGPTSDDITRELIADLLRKPLHEDARVLAHIENFFAVRKRPMPERNKVQALVPENALVLWNPNGTAPGLAMEVRPNSFRPDGKTSWLVMLPGPPRELRPMFDDAVVPLLQKEFPLKEFFFSRTLRTIGLGESLVQSKIGDPLQPFIQAGLELGYCAHTGQVDVRLAARGPQAATTVQAAELKLHELLGGYIFSEDANELEAVMVRLLVERRQTLALAESCTGGCIANRLTNVPGASAVLLAGLVTYSNEAKQKFLGVRAETLAQHGAVSEAVAREMAEGARRECNATYALSVTGIAGPTGGSESKPVGTAFMALASAASIVTEQHFNPYDRETFKQATALQALDLLRRNLHSGPP